MPLLVTTPALVSGPVTVPPLVTMPPKLLVTTVAVNDPPLPTVTVAELPIVPAFCVDVPRASVPIEIVQFSAVADGPPVNVQVLVPVFANCPNPWYFVPIWEKSNVLLVEPPSLMVSAALAATTLPTVLDPACISRLLIPPVKVIALARV